MRSRRCCPTTLRHKTKIEPGEAKDDGPMRTDEHAVAQVLAYLAHHQCPNPQRGEGSALFPPSDGLLTPDLVAGDFRGPTHSDTFFIDVVAPSGDYIAKPLAGAPNSAAFFRDQIAKRGTFGIEDMPGDLGKPLVGAIRKKATKYSQRRGGSPAFGVVAYFDERSKFGGHVITMLAYLKVLNDTLGPVNQAAFFALLEGAASMVVCPVAWDEPIAFLLQLVDGESPRGVLLVNTHARLAALGQHEVMVWANGLGT